MNILIPTVWDILFAALVSAEVMYFIGRRRKRVYRNAYRWMSENLSVPVLDKEENGQRWIYQIIYDGKAVVTGYSDNNYSPEEMTLLVIKTFGIDKAGRCQILQRELKKNV